MKTIYLILICFFSHSIFCNIVNAQAVNVNDSLALVDLYNSTNGPRWHNSDHWLVGPVRTWSGVTVTNNRVTGLYEGANGLKGTIPVSIGKMTKLEYLNLGSNRLSGSFPATLVDIDSLNYFSVDDNAYIDTIPAFFGEIKNLNFLDLSYNKLIGSIPSSLGKLTKLEYLILSSNKLSGTIPSSIGQLVKIRALSLEANELTGAIPSSLANLDTAVTINLSFNKLTGIIPASFQKLKNLINLELSVNKLSGKVPSFLGQLTLLNSLGLERNNFSGIIPPSFSNLKHLINLDLSYNNLSGEIPSGLNALTQLQNISLNNNALTGSVESILSIRFNYACEIQLQYNKFKETDNYMQVAGSYKTKANLSYNAFTFDGIELAVQKFPLTGYSPQSKLTTHKYADSLSVYAGGTLSNNTYIWFKVGEGKGTVIKGDSVFHPLSSGLYYAKIRNAIATDLVLLTDTISYTKSLKTDGINSAIAVAATATVYPALLNKEITISGFDVNDTNEFITTTAFCRKPQYIRAALYSIRQRLTGLPSINACGNASNILE